MIRFKDIEEFEKETLAIYTMDVNEFGYKQGTLVDEKGNILVANFNLPVLGTSYNTYFFCDNGKDKILHSANIKLIGTDTEKIEVTYKWVSKMTENEKRLIDKLAEIQNRVDKIEERQERMLANLDRVVTTIFGENNE